MASLGVGVPGIAPFESRCSNKWIGRHITSSLDRAVIPPELFSHECQSMTLCSSTTHPQFNVGLAKSSMPDRRWNERRTSATTCSWPAKYRSVFLSPFGNLTLSPLLTALTHRLCIHCPFGYSVTTALSRACFTTEAGGCLARCSSSSNAYWVRLYGKSLKTAVMAMC
jgi:hypothetical protein